jgi:hypothetical protein
VRVRAGLVLLVALAVLATPAPAAEQLKRHKIEGGVSFGIPNTWVAVDGRTLLNQANLSQLARDNPDLAPFINALAAAGPLLKFVAFDPVVRQGFATNINVVSAPLPGAMSFSQFRQVMVAQLQSIKPIGGVDDSVVRIGGQRAVRVSFRYKLTAGGRTFTVQTLQYAFLRGGKSVVFTYTTSPRHAARYAAPFKASAASIRFR